MTAQILLSDLSLRDGNHAVRHKITAEQVATYCRMAEKARIPVVEVGHGNGVGASSLQLGEAACSDAQLLTAARENLVNTRLGVHSIPGFATFDRDVAPALDIGVDIFRVASHCTEADITERFITRIRARGRTVFGVLMMSHMASPETLVEEASKMESYGAEGVIIMDSSGHYLPDDVTRRVSLLVERLGVPVGFHAHNNLGMAIANSVAATKAGASMLDGCSRGFGAGAGNAQQEVLVAVMERLGFPMGVDFYAVLDLADFAEKTLMEVVPTISSTSVVSGLAGVFSGFLNPVRRVSERYGVDPRDVFFELGRRQVVAGQEDLIIEVAAGLAKGRAAE